MIPASLLGHFLDMSCLLSRNAQFRNVNYYSFQHQLLLFPYLSMRMRTFSSDLQLRVRTFSFRCSIARAHFQSVVALICALLSVHALDLRGVALRVMAIFNILNLSPLIPARFACAESTSHHAQVCHLLTQCLLFSGVWPHPVVSYACPLSVLIFLYC